MNDSISTAKNAATHIQKRLAALGVTLTRSQALEAVAAADGFTDWNRYQAVLSKRPKQDAQLIHLSEKPILDTLITLPTKRTSVQALAIEAFTNPLETECFSDQHLRQITPNIEKLALYKVNIETMDPTIRNGSTLIMELLDDQISLSREDHGIYLITIYGHLHLIRLKHQANGILLAKDNPRYDSYLLANEDFHKTKMMDLFFIAKWTGKIV